MNTRHTWLACLVAVGCASEATSPAKPRASAPAIATIPSRSEMLAALPADTSLLIGVDVEKLRRSPIARQGWELFRTSAKGSELLAPLCGIEADVRYALLSMNFETNVGWLWLDGIRADARLDCDSARHDGDANARKVIKHGQYELSTSPKEVTETLWIGERTGLIVIRPAGAAPLGEPALRAAAGKRDGLTSTTLIGALVDHIDFNSGLTFAIDGHAMPSAKARGVAMSLEVDDALRAQVFVQLPDEDRAAGLRGQYRQLIDMALEKKLIDAGDTRVSGSGMAASVTLTTAQLRWWLETVRQYAAGHADP